jgi:hypothetical protein
MSIIIPSAFKASSAALCNGGEVSRLRVVGEERNVAVSYVHEGADLTRNVTLIKLSYTPLLPPQLVCAAESSVSTHRRTSLSEIIRLCQFAWRRESATSVAWSHSDLASAPELCPSSILAGQNSQNVSLIVSVTGLLAIDPLLLLLLLLMLP